MSNKTVINLGKENNNTRSRDFIKRAKKTYNIDTINDELKNISNFGGVYILSPYPNLDTSGRTVFKIGMSMQLKKRCDNYLTYFPFIFFHSFIVGFDDSEYKKIIKKNPEIIDDNDKLKKLKLFREISKIEKELINGIFELDKKCRKLQFTQREVASEWIYTKSKYIDEVALIISEKYGLKHKGYEEEFNETLLTYYNKTLPDTIFVGKILFN